MSATELASTLQGSLADSGYSEFAGRMTATNSIVSVTVVGGNLNLVAHLTCDNKTAERPSDQTFKRETG